MLRSHGRCDHHRAAVFVFVGPNSLPHFAPSGVAAVSCSATLPRWAPTFETSASLSCVFLSRHINLPSQHEITAAVHSITSIRLLRHMGIRPTHASRFPPVSHLTSHHTPNFGTKYSSSSNTKHKYYYEYDKIHKQHFFCFVIDVFCCLLYLCSFWQQVEVKKKAHRPHTDTTAAAGVVLSQFIGQRRRVAL